MTNAMSTKPIPKKQRQAKAFPKAFVKAIIPLWPRRSTWIPEKESPDLEKTKNLELELSTSQET
jgi:hypothetical protein